MPNSLYGNSITMKLEAQYEKTIFAVSNLNKKEAMRECHDEIMAKVKGDMMRLLCYLCENIDEIRYYFDEEIFDIIFSATDFEYYKPVCVNNPVNCFNKKEQV